MLHLFRRNGTRDGAPIEGADGTLIISHILTKFLKRLRHTEKPRLLDLGRLSGSNIEFFARHGFRVQVEDLLLTLDPDEARGAPSETRGDGKAPEASPADDRETPGGIVVASDAQPPAPATGSNSPAAAPTRPGQADARRPAGRAAVSSPAVHRPGARPSRRIVLPTRTFAASTPPLGRTAQAERMYPGGQGSSATKNALLPTKFAYADETFDALVGWDIFNYYDPGAMALLAAEARRILKPGGLLLGYFNARRPEGMETPRRYRILDEARVACDGQQGPTLRRFVYQNRDIEKLFMGLSIVELYFLKNATRELLMEKKSARSPIARSLVRPASPRLKFTIE